ncbi:MAG: hypothetical protein QW757_00335 [Candidatus Woesearchaeota archaeon]
MSNNLIKIKETKKRNIIKKEIQLTLEDYFDITPYKFPDTILIMLKKFSFYTS